MAKCGFWNAHLFLCQCGDKLRLLCLEIRAKAGWRGQWHMFDHDMCPSSQEAEISSPRKVEGQIVSKCSPEFEPAGQCL